MAPKVPNMTVLSTMKNFTFFHEKFYFVSHKMYSFWISPLKLKSVLQSVLANSRHALVINTCTNLVLAVHIVLTSITFCALQILHVLNLYNLGCPQDYTVVIKKKLLYMQKIWKLTRGQICCWKRDLNFILSSKRNTYVLFWPKQGRCLTADEAVAKIQEKDCLSCTTLLNTTKDRKSCQIPWNRWEKFLSNEEHMWLGHALCGTCF